MGIDPTVSILTATLNNLGGLKETVASVATQTLRNLEHIVVDGVSTDGTVDWLMANPYGIKWLSEPDRGIADALNKGLRMATGEWILVLHAEDAFVNSDSLAEVLPHLTGATGIASSDVLFVTKGGTRRLVSGGWTWKLNFKTTIPHQGALVRRRLFEEIGPFDESFRIALDYDFFLRAWRGEVDLVRTGVVLSLMPDTGLSSRIDWPSLRARFAEERQVHLAHCPHLGWRALYGLYWPAYLSYRRIRHFWQLLVARRTA